MLSLCKMSISMVYINVYLVYALFNNYIPYGTVIFGGLAITTAFFIANERGFESFESIKNELISISFFVLVVFVGSFIVADSESLAIASMIEFIEKYLLLLAIFIVCKEDNSVLFPMALFSFISSVAAAIVLFGPNNIGINRIRLSSNVSENALGNLMVLGVFCTLYLLTDFFYGLIIRLLAGMLIIIMSYVVLLTGSRKSIYAIGILLLTYCILSLVYNEQIGVVDLSVVISFALAVILVFMLSGRIGRIIGSTAMYDRIAGNKTVSVIDSDEGRRYFYVKAFQHFIESPILGIGFNNFVYQHGSYTHSTYAEILCGTGLLGTITYFYQYYELCAKIKYRLNKGVVDCCLKWGISFFLAYCFIGIGIGQMYDYISFAELSIIYAILNITVTGEDKLLIANTTNYKSKYIK